MFMSQLLAEVHIRRPKTSSWPDDAPRAVSFHCSFHMLPSYHEQNSQNRRRVVDCYLTLQLVLERLSQSIPTRVYPSGGDQISANRAEGRPPAIERLVENTSKVSRSYPKVCSVFATLSHPKVHPV